MKAPLSALWAASPSTLRRDPTNLEITAGYPCGAADIALFNEFAYRLSILDTELNSLLTAAGFTPDVNDVQQVLRSIRTQRMNYAGTAGGTGTALTLTLSPVPANLASLLGTPFRFLASAANGAAPTLNINSFGDKAIVWASGAPIAANAWAAGALLEVMYISGTDNFRLLSGASESINQFTSIATYRTAGAVTFNPVKTGLHRVTGRGGGAGGGGGQAGSPAGVAGGGGGGGFFQDYVFLTVGTPATGAVGAGGSGVAPSSTGTSGGATTFGSLTAQGGSGGAGANVSGFGLGGAGGGFSGLSALGYGYTGQAGYQGTPQIGSGQAGQGGNGAYGGGPGGPASFGGGNPGAAPGGGGSGSTAGGTGGNGAVGELIIEW